MTTTAAPKIVPINTASARRARATRRARQVEAVEPFVPLTKRPLPAGRPRKWYVTHNRRLKAMRLTIALLDTGVYLPTQASNEKIRTIAAQIGIHPPSDATCRLVRTLLRYSR